MHACAHARAGYAIIEELGADMSVYDKPYIAFLKTIPSRLVGGWAVAAVWQLWQFGGCGFAPAATVHTHRTHRTGGREGRARG